jgi:hypothetical protein
VDANYLASESMMRNIVAALAVMLWISGTGAEAQSVDPNEALDQLTGDAKGSAADNPQCRLFTPEEIGSYLGVEVGAGENAAGGAGCQWMDQDYEAQAILTVVGPDQYTEPSLVTGFKRLTGIGAKAWVAPESGWSAGALLDNATIIVSLDGDKADEATVVEFLREAVKRRQQ